jgi:ATP-dependent RNA helicase DeaD
MLRDARIEAEWIDAPTPEAIRAQDRGRLLASLLETVEFDEDDRELATRLMAERSPEDIAAALVHAHRAAMPQPEELIANTPAAREAAQKERHRPGFEDTVWFRLAVGRRQNADPRWILPILCRRGHVTRGEIGAIRIGPEETFVQIPRPIAGKFADALKRTAAAEFAAGEESLPIEASDSGPRESARQNRRDGPPRRAANDGPPRGSPKIHRKGPGKGKHPGNTRRRPKTYSDRKPRP